MKRTLLFTLALSFACCSHTTYTQGIPNLVQVRSNVWRSGQPETSAEWSFLRETMCAGRKVCLAHDLKLDFESEGSDDGARLAGFDVHALGIEPRTDPSGAIAAVAEVFELPAKDVVAEIYRQINTIPEIDNGVDVYLFHCKNGHDRTGWGVGSERRMREHWSAEKAWKEMWRRGYHRGLVGLDRQFWEKTPN